MFVFKNLKASDLQRHRYLRICLLSVLTVFIIIIFNLLPQLLVLSQVDRVLDEVDWLIARKKSQTASDKSSSGKKPFSH